MPNLLSARQYSWNFSCHCEGATHVDMSDNFGRTYACHCEGAERP